MNIHFGQISLLTAASETPSGQYTFADSPRRSFVQVLDWKTAGWATEHSKTGGRPTHRGYVALSKKGTPYFFTGGDIPLLFLRIFFPRKLSRVFGFDHVGAWFKAKKENLPLDNPPNTAIPVP